MAGFGEVASVKIFNPATNTLMTEEDFKKFLQANKANAEKESEHIFEEILPKMLEARAQGVKYRPEGQAQEATVEGQAPKANFFTGKTLFPKVKTNPRKEGTWGFKSFAIILATPGLTFEKFIELGGRKNDLAWDLDHDWVEVK